MGYGALISGLVSAGMQIYEGLSQPNPAHTAGIYAGQLRQQADTTLRPFTDPSQWNLNIPNLAGQSINFGLANAPAINQQQMQQLQGLLNQALPGYQGMVNQASANTASLLQGNVPADVQNQIQRSAAFQTLQSGAFAGGAPRGAVTARDLGLTSLNLQQTGFNQAQSLIGTARNYLMPQPVNPLSLLPLSDLIAGSEWSKQQNFNANVNYYNARANALAAQYGAPQSNPVGAVGSGIQAGLAALAAKNPQTGQTGMNSIMGLIGKLFNQGGGQTVGQFGDTGGGTSDFASLFGSGSGATMDLGTFTG